jgi:ribosomal protein S21
MSGICVKVRNGDITAALRIFKKKVNDEGILRDLKKHECHYTKSQKRKIKHKEALKRINKAKRLEEQLGNSKK